MTNVSALDSFISSLIRTKVADRNGDGVITKKEEAIFTFCEEAGDLSAKLYNADNNAVVNWAEVNTKLGEVTDNLATKQEAAALMYDLDADGKNGVTEKEIKEAADNGNKHADNLVKLLNLTNTNKVFDFASMVRYVDLIDVNDDDSVSDGEKTKFGSLVTSTRLALGGTETNSAGIKDIISKYVKGDSMSDLEKELIAEVKKGDYNSREVDETFDITGKTALDTTDFQALYDAVAALTDTESKYIAIYDIDNSYDEESGKITKNAVYIVYDSETEPRNIIAEYHVPAEADVDSQAKLEEYRLGAGDETSVGSLAYLEDILDSGTLADLVNVKCDSEGRIVSFGQQEDTAAKYQISYNSDGTISITKTTFDDSKKVSATDITTYKNGKEVSKKQFDENGTLIGILETVYDEDGNPIKIQRNNAKQEHPCIDGNRIVFANGETLVVPASADELDAVINANGLVDMGGKHYDTNGVEIDKDNYDDIVNLIRADRYDLNDFTVTCENGKITRLVAKNHSYTFSYVEGVMTSIHKLGKETTIKEGSKAAIRITDNSKLTQNSPQVDGMSIRFPANGNKTVQLNAGDTATIDAKGNVCIKDSSGNCYKLLDKQGNEYDAKLAPALELMSIYGQDVPFNLSDVKNVKTTGDRTTFKVGGDSYALNLNYTSTSGCNTTGWTNINRLFVTKADGALVEYATGVKDGKIQKGYTTWSTPTHVGDFDICTKVIKQTDKADAISLRLLDTTTAEKESDKIWLAGTIKPSEIRSIAKTAVDATHNKVVITLKDGTTMTYVQQDITPALSDGSTKQYKRQS